MAEDKKSKWLPLEANPDVMNKYVGGLGLQSTYQFHDVFGLDPELLAMLPQPCVALLLLFPVTAKYVQYKEEEAARLSQEKQTISPNVFYMKQFVGNACGTIGLLHAIGNNTNVLSFNEGYLKNFFQKTQNMSAEERGKYLEDDEEISEAHEASAQEGDTAPPARDESVDLHFVAIVQKDGHIYELDGTKDGPINHGPTTPDNFLNDAGKVCQAFMQRDPDEVHFTLVALAATE